MRSLALLWVLLSACVQADNSAMPEQRRREIAAAASTAAAGMGRAEYYVEFLQPMPNHALRVDDSHKYVAFGTGWSTIETTGIWSLGNRSTLFLRLASGSAPTRLLIHGKYYNGAEATRLLINGELVSEAPLQNLTVALPADAVASSRLKIELVHLHPIAPNMLDSSSRDARNIKFALMRLRLW